MAILWDGDGVLRSMGTSVRFGKGVWEFSEPAGTPAVLLRSEGDVGTGASVLVGGVMVATGLLGNAVSSVVVVVGTNAVEDNGCIDSE